MKLVQTRLCVGSTQQRRFHCRGGAVKHMQACLSARRDGKAVFSTVEVLLIWIKAVYVCEARYNAVFTVEEGL